MLSLLLARKVVGPFGLSVVAPGKGLVLYFLATPSFQFSLRSLLAWLPAGPPPPLKSNLAPGI